MNINLLNQIKEFLNDAEIQEEWLLRHMNIKFDDLSKTITIKIDNMNEQEYNWIKSEKEKKWIGIDINPPEKWSSSEPDFKSIDISQPNRYHHYKCSPDTLEDIKYRSIIDGTRIIDGKEHVTYWHLERIEEDPLLTKIKKILNGIDKDNCDFNEGYFCTSKGVEFGKDILKQIEDLFHL